MDKASEMLKKMNEMMSSAYVAKSGRPMKEILDLMDKETWLTAKQALKYGFADEILQEKPLEAVNSLYGLRLTEETMQQALKEVKEKKDRKDRILEDLELYGV
jgi:ATP-dependent Clp protease protease subunit